MVDERYEIVEFSPRIPVKIFMHKLGSVTKHWHRSLELLLVLEGEIEITIDGETSILKSEDIILINSNTIHSISSKNAVMIALQIKQEMFAIMNLDAESMIFDCNSSKDDNQEKFKGIKFAIARMIKDNAHKSESSDYKSYALIYYLISELLEYFKISATESIKTKQKHAIRLTRILNYINEHYKENFSLSDLAAQENLSVPYLSNFFDKHMGIKFSQYYTNVKLENAIKDLINTNDSIETIALNNGFTEYHTFVRAFKKKYETLPNNYRKLNREKLEKINNDNVLNYLLLEPSKYLHLLTKYLPDDRTVFLESQKKIIHKTISQTVQVDNVTKKLNHNFKNFIGVGRAKELLNQDIREMLIDLQKNIGYKYIKFHGILSDDMLVCTRNGDVLQFRYTLVDMVIDFLISINLKPLIQLSFMPLALASNSSKNVCESPFNTSPPRDINEWNELIEDFTIHLIKRYGKETVITWPFSLWNEPSTSYNMFGFDDNLQFFNFYKNTYDTVKGVCPEISFGSPSILSLVEEEKSWEKLFLSWTINNQCKPDFLNIHYYSDIVPSKADDFNISISNTSQFPKKSDTFKTFIKRIKKTFNSLGVGDLSVYLTEWNFTLSHRNLLSDTCFKSCYIMKNLLENYDSLDSFGYWCLTDLLEENSLPEDLFHGGLGIYTMNGMRKSVFYSFYFANMLGDDLIDSGNGYFITKSNNAYQIITYNYIHYGSTFAAGELFDITLTNRYSPFNMNKNIAFSLDLENITDGKYEVKEYFVNKNHGSAFDIWAGFGGYPLNPEDTNLLKGLCVPGFKISNTQAVEGFLNYSTILEPLEIRIAILTPKEFS